MADEEPSMTVPADEPGAREVRTLVRELVTEFAPEELPVVADIEQLEDATILRALQKPSRDDPLGFGLGEIGSLLAAVLWLVLGKAADAAVAGGLRRLANRFGRRRRATVPPLTRPQLVELDRHLRQEGARHGLPEATIERVADAVVSRLAIGDRPEEPDADLSAGT